MPDRVSKAGERTPLAELARLFLRLGATAFGGPAAHIAMMEDEVVVRRQWLSHQQFLDLLGAANLIPGPNSTEMAIYVGHARAGWPGLVVAGACFILPATFIVTALAWVYVRFGQLPQVAGILYGVEPVVIAIVVQAIWRLARSALKSGWLALLALAAALANALGMGEIAVLAVAAALAASTQTGVARWKRRAANGAAVALGASPFAARRAAALGAGSVASAAGVAGGTAAVGLWPLFTFFLKVGSVLFGSGYVLLAFLRSGLVAERGWLSEAQLLDAVAIGQVTPGPVFTTATFIGYLLAGGAGAAVATAGIFLPAFFFVAASGPLIPRLRSSPTAGAVLDGVNAASLALMAVVTLQLARAALVDLPTLVLAVLSALLLLGTRINSVWIVLAAAVAGFLLKGA